MKGETKKINEEGKVATINIADLQSSFENISKKYQFDIIVHKVDLAVPSPIFIYV